jgi:hypothetical protein
MTLDTVLLLLGIGAVVLAAGASAFRVSPWLIFGCGSLAGGVLLVLAAREVGTPCWTSGTASAFDRLLGPAAAASLMLFGAAALSAVVDAVRLGKAGERDEAIMRGVACPLASALGVGVVLYAFLAAVLHCLD